MSRASNCSPSRSICSRDGWRSSRAESFLRPEVELVASEGRHFIRSNEDALRRHSDHGRRYLFGPDDGRLRARRELSLHGGSHLRLSRSPRRRRCAFDRDRRHGFPGRLTAHSHHHPPGIDRTRSARAARGRDSGGAHPDRRSIRPISDFRSTRRPGDSRPAGQEHSLHLPGHQPPAGFSRAQRVRSAFGSGRAGRSGAHPDLQRERRADRRNTRPTGFRGGSGDR